MNRVVNAQRKMSSIYLGIYLIINILKYDIECKNHVFLKSFEIDENLLQKRCELICYRKTSDKCSLDACIKDISKLTKPGSCPNNKWNPQFYELCFDDCQRYDYECPGNKKCCRNNCGWSCTEPLFLENDHYLPPIPSNVTVVERRKNGRICEISWQISLNGTQKFPMFFIVEYRSFVGKVFSPHKLGDWQWHNFHKIAEMRIHETNTKTTVANIKLRAGRWYQFRVAAINEHGFRGYSNYSHEFRLSDENHITAPKSPKPPKNFALTPIKVLSNGSLYGKATWNAPKSDLPIEKYRISWALHLKAENHSLLQSDDYVKEPQRYYEFWNLAPNSIYYIQVQAISISGNKRLKSPKESLMLNTTLTTEFNNSNPRSILLNSTDEIYSPIFEVKNNTRRPEIVIRFIANKKFGMLVRVLWNELYRGSLLELCTGLIACESKEYNAVKTKKDHTDFSKLKFNTQYTVRLSVSGNSNNNSLTQEKTFVTPTCENWIRKFPNLNILC